MRRVIRGEALRAVIEAVMQYESGEIDRDQPSPDEASEILRSMPRGAVLVIVTPFQARALDKPISFNLDDVDFRRDDMTRSQLRAADELASVLRSVAYGKAST